VHVFIQHIMLECMSLNKLIMYFLFCTIFRVSDNGGGIKHEMLERIWEYGFTTPGVSERWSDHHIFERMLSNKPADSFCG